LTNPSTHAVIRSPSATVEVVIVGYCAMDVAIVVAPFIYRDT